MTRIIHPRNRNSIDNKIVTGFYLIEMSSYNQEQAETLSLVRKHLSAITPAERRQLRASLDDYLSFWEVVDAFLKKYFSKTCNQKCYENHLSTCCSREGIITFFADVVINALISDENELEILMKALQTPNTGFKCIYLGTRGCMWRMKPIVCEMFLCDQAKKDVFENNPEAEEKWGELRRQEKLYRWPDQPVLFDELECLFISAGYNSPLMYLNSSPGFLHVKRRAGLL